MGTGAAMCVLAVVVVILGPMLDRVPRHALQLVIGVLLLLVGIGWLRKAALRVGGIIPLHDENAIFAKETAGLTAEVARRQTSQDWIAGLDRRTGSQASRHARRCCSKGWRSSSS